MSDSHEKYEHPMVHHDPKEGFDSTEPDSKSIAGFVIGSVILLVAVILSLQFYWDQLFGSLVQEKVLSVPGGELSVQRSLEDWRLTHYEYTDKSKSAIRLPLDQAKALFLEEINAGKPFYPGKASEPKPEVPPAPADSKEAKTEEKGKQGKK